MYRLSLFLLFLVGAAVAQDKPVPPAEAPKKFTLPKGFTATLFAGEPDVVQPIAFTFDDRGRVWVVECLSYPIWKQDGTGNDRLVMLEDTDGDGQFDKRQVVFDKGSNLSGIELGFGGVWLCSSPNLVFLPCDFNADTPTIGKPEILLDGWNCKDTKHNIFNSLIWGPDGWLYGCNGIQSRSNVGKPGAAAKDRVEINCGVWRYHPTRKVFEAFAHGTTNPFGLDYDAYGEFFMTNCVIKHLFHVVPGGHFDRMYGQDINPHSYALIPSVADYIHWAGGDWTTSRGNKPEHSDAGGGHAHSGAVIYQGGNFPSEYYNSLLTCNIHGNRLNRDTLKYAGSGYKSERARDFLFANDSWFRGIAVHTGPEGALYVSDWCDTGECHNYDKADTSNGRIHRVMYGQPTGWRGNLAQLKDVHLLDLQMHKNDWFVRHARRILQERAATKKLDVETLLETHSRLDDTRNPLERLRMAWLLTGYNIGWVPEDFLTTGLRDQSQEAIHVRAWGIRLVLEEYANSVAAGKPNEKWATLLTQHQYAHPMERLALASGLRRLAPTKRTALATKLLTALEAEDAKDQNLPLLAWYAVEPEIGDDVKLATFLLAKVRVPQLREFIARKLVATKTAHMTPLLTLLPNVPADMQRDLLQGITDGLGGVRELPVPDGWAHASPSVLTSNNADVRQRAMALAVTFGDKDAIARMKQTVADTKAEVSRRTTALHVLLRRQQPDLLALLVQLLDDKPMRAEAIRGLAAFNDASVPLRLVKLYPHLSDAEKEDAVQTLAARSEWALALLDAVEQGSVPRKDVSVFVARQMQGLKDKRVGDRLTKVWGQLQPASAQRAALTKKYKDLLTEPVLTKADVVKGRQVFVKNCASCHKLYDDGGDVGPALTGAQRANLDYILENVLDPSAVVPREYQVNAFELKSGRTLNAIVVNETPNALTVRTANEKLIVPKDEIESRKQSKLSMMPEGLFDKLPPDEVVALVAYLRSREQVPLPK